MTRPRMRPRALTVPSEPILNRVPVAHECVEGHSRRISWRNPLGLPAPLTWKQVRRPSRVAEELDSERTLTPLGPDQILYIVGPQMIGAACIDGGANFGVACVADYLAPSPVPSRV